MLSSIRTFLPMFSSLEAALNLDSKKIKCGERGFLSYFNTIAEIGVSQMIANPINFLFLLQTHVTFQSLSLKVKGAM